MRNYQHNFIFLAGNNFFLKFGNGCNVKIIIRLKRQHFYLMLFLLKLFAARRLKVYHSSENLFVQLPQLIFFSQNTYQFHWLQLHCKKFRLAQDSTSRKLNLAEWICPRRFCRRYNKFCRVQISCWSFFYFLFVETVT